MQVKQFTENDCVQIEFTAEEIACLHKASYNAREIDLWCMSQPGGLIKSIEDSAIQYDGGGSLRMQNATVNLTVSDYYSLLRVLESKYDDETPEDRMLRKQLRSALKGVPEERAS
jgi:hypothetical protein